MPFLHWFASAVVSLIVVTNLTAGAALLLARSTLSSRAQDGALVLFGLTLGPAAYACGWPLLGACLLVAPVAVAASRTLFRQDVDRRTRVLMARVTVRPGAPPFPMRQRGD